MQGERLALRITVIELAKDPKGGLLPGAPVLPRVAVRPAPCLKLSAESLIVVFGECLLEVGDSFNVLRALPGKPAFIHVRARWLVFL